MDKLRQLLSAIGIDEQAIGVYTHLFISGESSMIDIAHALSIHRPRLYQLIDDLTLRGLVVTVTHGKRKKYMAAPPERVSDIFTALSKEMNDVLPQLSREYRQSKEKPVMTHFEGRTGVTNVFADVVESTKRGETFYRFSSEKDLDHTNTYLPRDYRKRRDEKKLERFVITAPRVGKGKKARMERAMKYIPEGYDLFDQDVIELIYANKVAFIDLSTEHSFVIESAALADFHKKLFRLLYQKL